MQPRLSRMLTATVTAVGTLVSFFFALQSWKAMKVIDLAAQEFAAAEQADRRPASANGGVTLASLDEIFANLPRVLSGGDIETHSLGVKIDLELFDDEARSLLDQRVGGIKNAVILTVAEQDFDRLNTVAGKLFFKELLVARINGFFNRALVRDVHFASFYLQ